MEPDPRIDEIVAKAREARDAGREFDIQAACDGDPDLLQAVATSLAIQRLLDGAYASARKDAIAQRAPPVKPGQRVGTYRVVSKIGQGGMGTVFLALAEQAQRDLPLGTRVALKVIHPHLLTRGTFLDRFRREVRAGLRLQHENVVPTLGAGTIE